MKVVIILQLVMLTLVKAQSDLAYSPSAKPSAVFIKTCCDLRTFPASSGVYKINTGTFSTTNVYCDMSTDNGGWIVVQRNRKNSQLSFIKNWKEYEDGFGDLNGDFWAGLKLMHALTQSGQWEMRVDYQKETDNIWTYLHYNHFSVESATKEYQLSVNGYAGKVSFGSERDPFTGTGRIANGMRFTTYDNENDREPNINCAATWLGGWWHNDCYRMNINRQPPEYEHPNKALFTEMKIRPKDCIV